MKRFLCMLAVLCLLSGLLVVLLCLSAAAQTPVVTGLSSSFGSGSVRVNGHADRDLTIWNLEYLRQIESGTTLFVPLTAADFTWSGAGGTVTPDNLGSLGVSIGVEAGPNDDMELLKSAGLALQNGTPGMLIAFVDGFPATDPREFSFTVKVLVGGQPQPGGIIPVRGTMSNVSVPVRQNDTRITLGPGRYAQGMAEVHDVRFNLGAEVSIVSHIREDERFYGAAVEYAREQDRVVMEKYPQIAKVIQVSVVRLNGRVEFNIPGYSVMQVYDSALGYLGTTEDKVPLRSTYYLATSRLG